MTTVNLAPLFLDRNSGNIYTGTAGLLTPTGRALNAFLYTQTSAAITWTINYGVATSNVLIQIYDQTGNLILPDSIVINSSTYTATVTFADAQAGQAILMLIN